MAAIRRRRRYSGSEEGSEDESVSSENSQPQNIERSDCESEGSYEHNEEHNSEYESAEENPSQDDDGTRSAESDIKGKEKEEERTSGDGQEESKDLAKDVTNPQYIPRRGPFFEHDVRMTSNKEDTNIRPKTKKKLWKEDDKWSHDMYREDEQTPKSREEIITMYGFDMRSGSLNDAGYPRPQRGRRMRGRQGPRPQFRDNRGFENNQNDNSQTDQTDMQYEQKESQYEWSQQQNNRPYYRRGGRNRGNMNYRGNDRRQSDSDAPYRENRSPVDKQIRSFGHGREWTNTNYKKQREDTINPQQGDGDGIHMHTSSVDRTSRETKSYMKDRRRPPTHRAPEEQESSTDAGNQDNKEMESNMEKLSITVEASHIGQGDHVPDRSIDANNSVVRPAPNSYTNSRHQPLNQDRNVQSKTQPQPQRSGHSTRPKRYSTQRQRQMPDPAPPPALHPPPLMDPQYFDPAFQGPMYHPSNTPPTRHEGTPPPPGGPPPGGPPHGGPHHPSHPPPPGDRLMHQGMMVQHDINMLPGMQHPSPTHIANPNMYPAVPIGSQQPPPQPPPGTFAPAFVSPVVSYTVPHGPPPPPPPYQMTAPPPAPVPAPLPPQPLQPQQPQFPVTSQAQMYGGITYYSPEMQQHSIKRTPPRRPPNPIPIQPPPENTKVRVDGQNLPAQLLESGELQQMQYIQVHEQHELQQHDQYVEEKQEEGSQVHVQSTEITDTQQTSVVQVVDGDNDDDDNKMKNDIDNELKSQKQVVVEKEEVNEPHQISEETSTATKDTTNETTACVSVN